MQATGTAGGHDFIQIKQLKLFADKQRALISIIKLAVESDPCPCGTSPSHSEDLVYLRTKEQYHHTEVKPKHQKNNGGKASVDVGCTRED